MSITATFQPSIISAARLLRACLIACAMLALGASASAETGSYTQTITTSNPDGNTDEPNFFFAAPTGAHITSWTIVVISAQPTGPSGSRVQNDQIMDDGRLRLHVHVPAGGSFSASVTVFWETNVVVPPVVDLAPVITVPANIVVGNDPGRCDAVVTFPVSPTALDDHDGVRPVFCSPASGSIFECGVTTVNCTATDTTGHTGYASFTVTVEDREPPKITVPADITVGNDWDLCGATVTFAPTASDNCDGVVAVTCDPASGSFFECEAPTVVHCTAKDKAGNVAHASFTVTVKDVQPPRVNVSVATSVLWSPNHNFVDVGLVEGAWDNCKLASVTVGVTQDEPLTALGSGVFGPDAKLTLDTDGNRHLWLRSERAGTLDGRVYLIAITATDTSGNVGTGHCTVVVPKSKSAADQKSIEAQAAAATSPLFFNSFEWILPLPKAKG